MSETFHPTLCQCGEHSAVIDSRPSLTSVRRRRKCDVCGKRWTTFELHEDTVPTMKQNDLGPVLMECLNGLNADQREALRLLLQSFQTPDLERGTVPA